MSKTIVIAAAILQRPAGHILLVRKRGTEAFMQPGGKIDPHETSAEALLRELYEELGIHAQNPHPIGRFSAPAANEPDHIVTADLFHVPWNASVQPQAEIAEIQWIDPHQPCDIPLAPLTRDEVLPLCRNNNSQPFSLS